MGDERYRKEERLRRQSDIDACYRGGRRASGRLLRVHVRATGLPVARLAISVPGRLCNSVLRNRWKRMIREAFRRNKARVGTGIDLVVVPQRPPGELTTGEVAEALVELVGRARGTPS